MVQHNSSSYLDVQGTYHGNKYPTTYSIVDIMCYCGETPANYESERKRLKFRYCVISILVLLDKTVDLVKLKRYVIAYK